MRAIVFAMLLCGMVPSAESQSYIPWPSAAKAPTVRATLEAFQQVGRRLPEVEQAFKENRDSLALVFVPGIMGSSLTDKDGKVIYGDLSSPGTLITRLELPASLIDETAESGIRANLLRSLGPVDLYGDASDKMSEWAAANRIKFLACGYDWRRDIRSGARDLERCIKDGLGPQHKNLVILAHSMGGLVSWTWAMAHERNEYSANRRVLLLTTLGSPLSGSCEIIRMVQSGYIQPERNETNTLRPDLKPLQRLKEKFVDALSNGVSGALTQGIRPLVLTWPGAIELSPRTPSDTEKISCVGIPAPENQPPGTPPTLYYSTDFWTSAAGRQMLRQGAGPESYPVPKSLPMVLAKARQFRDSFNAKQLKSPAWLYYSRMWLVPTEAGYKAPYITDASQWSTSFGDGRVPYPSAMNSPDYLVFSHRVGLESVHGNLPDDPNFFDDFFGDHLPRALAAYWAVDMMQRASSRPEWVKEFAKIRPMGADVNDVRVALEPQGTVTKPTERLVDALRVAGGFNEQICKARGGCSATYAQARKKIADGVGSAARLTEYSAVLRQTSPDDKQFAFAEGNRGLTHAKTMNWAAAAVSMKRAEDIFESTPPVSAAADAAEGEFKLVLERNLAKSLVESGQCKAAEPYLLASAESSPYSKQALSKPCNDVESGLQYCFDIKDYCKAKN